MKHQVIMRLVLLLAVLAAVLLTDDQLQKTILVAAQIVMISIFIAIPAREDAA